MDTIACPMCGQKEFSPVAARADGLKIVRCRQCSLAFINPRPDAEGIAAMYAKDYYRGDADKAIGYSAYRSSVASIHHNPPAGWTLLDSEVAMAGARTLDVGCAFGHLVYWMAKSGATATGIDLSDESVAWGQSKLKLDLRRCLLEELQEPDGSFDLVTMIDLIEHVTDLKSFMTRLAGLLKPGGKVLIQTPNFGTYRGGDRHTFLHFSLEHLLYFDPATLDGLMALYGLEPEKPTRVAFSVPLDADEYRQQCQIGPGRLHALVGRMPGGDIVRRVKWWLSPPSRPEFRFDPTGKQGAAIVGLYRKAPATI